MSNRVRQSGRWLPAAFRHDRRGAAAIEFAIVFPIVILLSFGGFELARAMWAQAAINHAVKETVRFASVRGAASGMTPGSDAIEAMALAIADLDTARTTATVNWDPDTIPGSVVTVQMQHDFRTFAMPIDIGRITLDATASMTVIR